jgi:hypothetical protein
MALRLALTICGVLAWWVVPAAAGAAAPRFGEPVVLRAPSTLFAGEPAVAVSASGGIVAAWDQQFSRRVFGIVVRRGTTSGRFGAAERVTASGVLPAVAAGRGGGAAVIWETQQRGGTRRVRVAVAAGRRRFGRPQTLARVRANVTSQQVIATGGRFVAIWWQGIPGTGRHAVRFALSDAAGHFGATRTLAPDTGPSTGVSAAAAPDGTVTATWGTPLGGTVQTNQQLAYAQLAPGATRFGAPTTLRAAAADQGAETTSMHVDAGPGGTALGWTEAGHLPELLRASALTRGAAATPETVFTLDSSDLGKRYAVGPSFALPAGGLAPVAAWAVLGSTGGESESITSGQVFAGERRADGTYSDPTQLSASDTIATLPVAGATRTAAVVAWATGDFGRYGLRYAVRPAGGTFGTARALTTSHAERGALLASSSSAVVAVWTMRPGAAGPHPQGARHGIALAILRELG